ncbi:unnamed protein product [Urochloa decumbens]|uniref:DUF659 domain-containing protein n=1 Tax=Urochloa decumbens TaxID=240449 RepID=A0ABC8Y0E0_9POAL
MKKGQDAQRTHVTKSMRKKRKRVIERIAAWFSEAGIPFNTVCLESFDLMLDAIAKFGPGLRGPSLDELGGPLLHRQVLAINDSIESLKESWVSAGCSILVHRECDANGTPMLNLAVHCSQGVSFLRSILLPSDSKSDAYVFQLVDSCVEEVGEKNVVQVVTNINSQLKEAKMFTAKRPNMFWTKCAASCVDLILEDIGHIPLIKKTITKARSLTAFIYGQTHLLDMARQYTDQQDLVHVGITYYTTCCLNLRSLYDKRVELMNMFVSKEWEDSKLSKGAVGKKFYNLVVSNEFWDGVLYVINCFEPLVDVLRRMGSGIASMACIYGDLKNAKKEIALRCENKEEHYLPVWEYIDFRSDLDLKTPLHLAGYPFFYYPNKDETDKSAIFRDALDECMCNMYQDPATRVKIVHQLKLYMAASQDFLSVHAMNNHQINIDPVSWWELFGGESELSTMAERILRLTCGSLSYEQSWIEAIHKKKPSWIKRKQFEDSIFVTVNRRIQAKAELADRDPVLAYLPDEDEPFEWLMGMFRCDAQQPENHALLMARANSNEVGLPMQAKKILEYEEFMSSEEEGEESDDRRSFNQKVSSSASCSKHAKRPRLSKVVLEE